jgi:hypothetical protein
LFSTLIVVLLSFFSCSPEPVPSMTFVPALALFKKPFDNVKPSSWHDVYDHEYNFHNLHLGVAETTTSQYRRLSDLKKLRKFIMANSHWGILILNEDNKVILIHTICCKTSSNEEFFGFIGNELLLTPVEFKIDSSFLSEHLIPEEEMTKHLVNIITICNYFDDKPPLPPDIDDDIATLKDSLLKRKYAFGPSKSGKISVPKPDFKEGANDTKSNLGKRHHALKFLPCSPAPDSNSTMFRYGIQSLPFPI